MECEKLEKKRINISNIINAIVISIFIVLVCKPTTQVDQINYLKQ